MIDFIRRNDMRLGELKSVLFSSIDNIQSVIIYSRIEHNEIENGCSAEYAIKNYGKKELLRIQAANNNIVLIIE